MTFNFFFQSREKMAVRRGQIRRIEWVIKILETQVGQFLSGQFLSIDSTSIQNPPKTITSTTLRQYTPVLSLTPS